MTQKKTSEERQPQIEPQDMVGRYLGENPDYFLRHPEILAGLKLTHNVGEKAVSLIERQVQALRKQNQALTRQLQDLVTIARENDVLAARLHRFALAIADASTLDDVFDTTYEILGREFTLDAVRVLISGEASKSFHRAEFLATDRRLVDAMSHTSVDQPLCNVRLEDSLMKYLFGDSASGLESIALIVLAGNTRRGLLCLGSHDARRFHPGMGTIYLTKIGDIVMHGILRFA